MKHVPPIVSDALTTLFAVGVCVGLLALFLWFTTPPVGVP